MCYLLIYPVVVVVQLRGMQIESFEQTDISSTPFDAIEMWLLLLIVPLYCASFLVTVEPLATASVVFASGDGEKTRLLPSIFPLFSKVVPSAPVCVMTKSLPDCVIKTEFTSEDVVGL